MDDIGGRGGMRGTPGHFTETPLKSTARSALTRSRAGRTAAFKLSQKLAVLVAICNQELAQGDIGLSHVRRVIGLRNQLVHPKTEALKLHDRAAAEKQVQKALSNTPDDDRRTVK